MERGQDGRGLGQRGGSELLNSGMGAATLPASGRTGTPTPMPSLE